MRAVSDQLYFNLIFFLLLSRFDFIIIISFMPRTVHAQHVCKKKTKYKTNRTNTAQTPKRKPMSAIENARPNHNYISLYFIFIYVRYAYEIYATVVFVLYAHTQTTQTIVLSLRVHTTLYCNNNNNNFLNYIFLKRYARGNAYPKIIFQQICLVMFRILCCGEDEYIFLNKMNFLKKYI